VIYTRDRFSPVHSLESRFHRLEGVAGASWRFGRPVLSYFNDIRLSGEVYVAKEEFQDGSESKTDVGVRFGIAGTLGAETKLQKYKRLIQESESHREEAAKLTASAFQLDQKMATEPILKKKEKLKSQIEKITSKSLRLREDADRKENEARTLLK